jgi:hypothetical protein
MVLLYHILSEFKRVFVFEVQILREDFVISKTCPDVVEECEQL